MYLHELLTGSEVYVEPLKLPEKVGAFISCQDLFYFKSKLRIIIRKFPEADMKCTHQTKHDTVNEQFLVLTTKS